MNLGHVLYLGDEGYHYDTFASLRRRALQGTYLRLPAARVCLVACPYTQALDPGCQIRVELMEDLLMFSFQST